MVSNEKLNYLFLLSGVKEKAVLKVILISQSQLSNWKGTSIEEKWQAGFLQTESWNKSREFRSM